MNGHEFEIGLHFEKNSRDPSRVFYSMGEYIDSFAFLDSSLLFTLNTKIESHVVLEDIQAGSIKAKICRVLKLLDDTSLRSGDWKKIVGCFLHKGKYKLLKFLGENEQIDDPKLLESKVAEINKLAEETHLFPIPAYRPFTSKDLITSAQGLVSAGKRLTVEDKVIYRSGGEELEISRSVSISQEVLDEVLPPPSDHQHLRTAVVIKKVDLLGDSQWEFRHQGRTIRAHILDCDWLKQFRQRKFEIKPGDALSVIMDISLRVTEKKEKQEAFYEIVQVLGIVPGDVAGQSFMFD